jgi:hypothetical protein
MEFKGSEVCKPDEGVEVVAQDEMDLAISSLGIAGKYVHVVRGSLRGIFLVKRFSSNSRWVPVHGERPVMEKWKYTRSHSDIIGNNFLFGDVERRVHDPAQVGQMHPGEIAERGFFFCHGKLPANPAMYLHVFFR